MTSESPPIRVEPVGQHVPASLSGPQAGVSTIRVARPGKSDVVVDDPLLMIDKLETALADKESTFQKQANSVRECMRAEKDGEPITVTEAVSAAYAVKAWAIRLGERYFPTPG